MKPQQLESKIKSGEIDTVITAFVDIFGRLVGKRFTGRFFLDSVAAHGTHGCNYLFTVNIEMDPLDGFALANWKQGFGDFEMRPDMSTLREIPWIEGTALVLCDVFHHDGTPVAQSPRQVLHSQVDKLDSKGLRAGIAGELEFFLVNQTFEEAFQNGYSSLTPSSDYRIDYQLMQPTRDEGFLRAVRNQMTAAGVPIESSKGEWGRGQHEINFQHGEPVTTADCHAIFKHGIKELAALHGRALTFMPKIETTEAGNSCHIHVSLWDGDKNVFWDAEKKEGSETFRQFLGGLIKYTREFAYFFAPTINAYKRYQSASWAPTKLAWAFDNRTVGFRVVGHGNSFRIENRMPGADANPYYAYAATLAAGLAGIEEKLDCGDVYEGNAYEDPKLMSLPGSLEETAELLNESETARKAFGDPVIEHLVHTARLEVRAFKEAVTDWERRRYFERI